MSEDIDKLRPTKSLIDLSDYRNDEFTLGNYQLDNVIDDIVLAEYVDCNTDNTEIERGGVIIPLNAVSKAWRLGKVVLAGSGCNLVKNGDIICFPADRGIPAKNIVIKDHGRLKHGIFLNEERIFGICSLVEDED